ncbi:XRCC4-like factor-domain-containing protein [Neurospora hispaniola]|uniref:Non-homologous end-joining factor 1 n=1 Tax=Neurospora hispaniola TaxID=588809 RepID=A0AAJ0IE66_9PEZI|nr:XRCC4-like factor-domain-containing protein [Neurospora hispaniola]
MAQSAFSAHQVVPLTLCNTSLASFPIQEALRSPKDKQGAPTWMTNTAPSHHNIPLRRAAAVVKSLTVSARNSNPIIGQLFNMSKSPPWRPLPVTAPGIPNLLVATNFTAQSYKVHLTDLANVWVENMDRRPIMGRASAEDTSIDPTDGNENLQRLLDWIRAAFDIDDPGHRNTSLTLGKGKDDSIEVQITCILPEPFKPLKWPLYLKKCSASALATELVLPLIQLHEARAQEINHLIATIRDKDAVINRLVDKLEANGIGLEHIFNKLPGKRKVGRKEAEGKIKGLATFVEADFRNDGVQGTTRSTDVPTLLDTVFRETGLKHNPEMEFEASAILDTWWTELGRGRKLVLAERSRREIQTPPPPESPAKEEHDDDFQVQATPPGFKSASKRRGTATRQTVIDNDDTTSDGEDEDVQMTQNPPPLLTKASPESTPAHRLGTLGGRKRPPSRSPSSAIPEEDDGLTSETASEAEEDASSPPPSSSKPAPRKGGLGRIGGMGGRAKHKDSEQEPQPEHRRSPSSPSASQPKRHKLGMIGKAPSPEDSRIISRGRSKSPSAAPKPRETSEERADRKRTELQKELERKATGPAKKKRRF